MPLTIYNTLSRKKEEFTPLVKDRVNMYYKLSVAFLVSFSFGVVK